MNLVSVPTRIIAETLTELRRVGRQRSESVVLWLGSRDASNIQVEKMWVPEQVADYDYFWIPEYAMERLFTELRSKRLMIAAQIHTHPRRAFHSYADDQWAVVRHTGALSLVLPHFAQRTQPGTFIMDAAAFVLSPQNTWLEISKRRILDFYQITP